MTPRSPQRQEEALAAARRLTTPLRAKKRASWNVSAPGPARRRTAQTPSSTRSGDGWTAYVPHERVIVFTEYRDTQRWLHERLIGAGYAPGSIAQLYGGQDEDEREHIKAVFQDDLDLDPLRILLATDAASEGINLQNHCHRLLHWEIPWNPNRLEQRNGRIDRHGQPAPEVNVYHFVPQGWERSDTAQDPDDALADELHFLYIAAKKTENIREDLGSAGDVIAAQVEQKMLGRRTDWQTADVEIERRTKLSRAELRIARDLARDLQRLTETLADSRSDLNLTPQAVEHVVRTALKLAFNKDLTSAPGPDGFPAPCFRVPELPGTWAQARNEGLYHPVTGKERPVTFDGDAAAEHTDVVLLHLGHHLVQMCLQAAPRRAVGDRPQDRCRPGCTGSPPGSCPPTCSASPPSSATSASSSPAPRAPACTRRSCSPAAPSRRASWSAPGRKTFASGWRRLRPHSRPTK